MAVMRNIELRRKRKKRGKMRVLEFRNCERSLMKLLP
jgi:hypothetical protein